MRSPATAYSRGNYWSYEFFLRRRIAPNPRPKRPVATSAMLAGSGVSVSVPLIAKQLKPAGLPPGHVEFAPVGLIAMLFSVTTAGPPAVSGIVTVGFCQARVKKPWSFP